MYRACYETLEGVVNYGQGNLVKKKKKDAFTVDLEGREFQEENHGQTGYLVT